MAHPWPEITLVLVAGVALIVALGVCRLIYPTHPEFLRKLLHVGVGLIALSFPWLFASAWPVLVVAAVAALIVCAVRASRHLRTRLGGVLDGVARRSRGEYFFLAATVLLFGLADGDALLFCVPMLILTFADTAAALVGTRFGRLRYGAAGGQRSVEGSAAFVAVAFVCACVPLALIGGLAVAQVVMVAGVLAVLTAIVEAVARQGADNLLVPLGAFLVLKTML